MSSTPILPAVEIASGLAGHEGLRAALAPAVRPATSGPRSLILGPGDQPGSTGVEAVILIAPEAAPEVAADIDLLAIFGARDPARSERMAQLRAAHPAAMIALIHGAGADPAQDRPDLVARAAADFAARRQATVVSNRDGRHDSRPILGDEA